MSELLNMTVGDALKKLGIEEHAEKIVGSNSHCELGHLIGYCEIAVAADDTVKDWFPEWFDGVVEAAQGWTRPESIYQWIPKLFWDAKARATGEGEE